MVTKNQEVEIVGMGAKNLKTTVTGIGELNPYFESIIRWTLAVRDVPQGARPRRGG